MLLTIEINQSAIGNWRFKSLYLNDLDGQIIEYWAGLIDGKIVESEGPLNKAVLITSIPTTDNPLKEIRFKYYLKYFIHHFRYPYLISYGGLAKPSKWEIDKDKLNYPLSLQIDITNQPLAAYLEGAKIIYISKDLTLNLQIDDQDLKTFICYLPCNLILELQYKGILYIYDFITSVRLTYNQRLQILQTSIQAYLQDGHQAKSFTLIENRIAYNKEQILNYAEYSKSLGFKGILIRKFEGPSQRQIESSLYKVGKTKNVLKY